ncbi:MAG: YdcF family protein [Moraxella sp.]|nr:YdcF family protein [Moraxella sp.]
MAALRHFKRHIKRHSIRKSWWFKTLLYMGAAALLVAISTTTPIFPVIVGKILEKTGDYYGNVANNPYLDTPSKTKGIAPQAYIILGGGLTADTHGKTILNIYSKQRAKMLKNHYIEHPLPIVVSGVEAPWLNAFLGTHNITNVISDNASMNTCENARFSAKILAHEYPTPVHHAYLITDWYHMARARRQFALLGISTTPIAAPLPDVIGWFNPKSNLNHSRRAFYETAALMRDIIQPQDNCRTADNVSIETIQTPRGTPKVF